MKQKRPYSQVYPIARQLVERLRPFCVRIELAGSLRRKRPEVGDIELVAIPKLQRDLFERPTGLSMLDEILPTLPLTFVKNGPKYKQFTFRTKQKQVYTVDLFLQTAETWGVNFLIFTGSAEFSHKMVTAVSQGGYKPNDLRVAGARVWRDEVALPTPEEQYVFDLWGMDWIEPEAREV